MNTIGLFSGSSRGLIYGIPLLTATYAEVPAIIITTILRKIFRGPFASDAISFFIW